MATEEPRTLQSSKKLFEIVDQLLELEEAGVTELANHTSHHKSTVYVHLQTLQRAGLVVKRDGRYRPSFKFLEYGERVRRGSSVYAKGRGEIDSLARETGELASLGVPEGGNVVVIHAAEGEKAVHDCPLGSTFSMRATAIGRAILAHLPEDDSEGELSDRDSTATADRHGGREDVAEVLADVRSRGFAVVDDEGTGDVPYVAAPRTGQSRAESRRVDLEVRSVAAPVTHRGRPVAAVNVTGPAKRISGAYQDRVRKQVVNTARLIETKLKYQS